MPDTSKLPKWAQDHIRLLEMRVREADKRAATLFGPANTNVTWVDYGHGTKHPLPSYASVRFSLAPHGYVEVRVERERNRVYVSAGEECLVVRPEATNVVTLTTVPL